jgi:hypothetical protein
MRRCAGTYLKVYFSKAKALSGWSDLQSMVESRLHHAELPFYAASVFPMAEIEPDKYANVSLVPHLADDCFPA